jgi:hypothetical protein
MMQTLTLTSQPILDPRLFGVTNSKAMVWRTKLKLEIAKRRKYLSDFSGISFIDCDMHEGILPRAVVPKGIDWSYMIYHEYNCFLLLRSEHIHPPSREWCIQKSFERYGKDQVCEWFYSLPWKSVPFKIENY